MTHIQIAKPDFLASEEQAAYGLIAELGLDIIRCSETGAPIGTISESEIAEFCNMLTVDSPMITAEEMCSEFRKRHVIFSSRQSPLLSVHTDKNQMRRLLEASEEGRIRLFTQLAGRLLYVGMVNERQRDTYEVIQSRLTYRSFLYDMLQDLPKGWSHSLTEDDEIASPAEIANAILADSIAMLPTAREEAKAAQRCLEALIRLDAFFSIKNVIYDKKIEKMILALRNIDSPVGYFNKMAKTLTQVEDNNIVQSHRFKRSVEGNAMALTAALMALSMSQTRIDKMTAKLEAAQIREPGKGNHIIEQIEALIPMERRLTKTEKKSLRGKLLALDNELTRTTYSQQKIDALTRAYSRGGDETTTVKRGIGAATTYARLLRDEGRKIPEPLKARLQTAVNAGNKMARVAGVTKPSPNADAQTAAKKKGRPMNPRRAAMLASLMRAPIIDLDDDTK